MHYIVFICVFDCLNEHQLAMSHSVCYGIVQTRPLDIGRNDVAYFTKNPWRRMSLLGFQWFLIELP